MIRSVNLIWIFVSCSLMAQDFVEQKFSRADTLRGMLSPQRTCYDVKYYHLDIRIDPQKKWLGGSNTIEFQVDSAFHVMQIDLYDNMGVEEILFEDGNPLDFRREFNAIFIIFPKELSAGQRHSITVYYSGEPVVAERPPWQGGFTWESDEKGNPWVAVTCQGDGASLWWPNKDHQSDEPDSMLISVTVPAGLENISNGRLRNKVDQKDAWTRFDWFVSYPINNYNVTINIGKYAHFEDYYVNEDTLTLDYYVLPKNVDKAKRHFTQVKGMIEAFEHYFGPYPFIRDGFKLIECPHTGMEHQSAVAYGNHYLGGYRGRAPSASGLKFDFIIIHESAHEWWGNSVTSNDIADMWIHESFGAYAEALYIEYFYGYAEALKYINGKKQGVRNKKPIIGPFDVNKPGSGDMYNKGQLILNTLRHVINNDSLWFAILKGLHESFKYQSIDGTDIFHYINNKTGKDLDYFFKQYFGYPKIPRLDVFVAKKGEKTMARFKWHADVEDFQMPVKVITAKGKYEFIYPTVKFQFMDLGSLPPEEFKIAEDQFYVDLNLRWTYIDPEMPDNPEK